MTDFSETVRATSPVLITGCSSGIGRCAAFRLRALGYPVLATARQQADVEDLQAEGFDAWPLDLAEESSIHRAVDQILDHTQGHLYGLINNGAYGQPGAVEDLPVQALREQFEVNLFGTHALTRRVLPVLLARGRGRIIQNSSVLGFVSMPLRGAYVASKFALEGLTDTLRLELRDTGVFVCLIEPGPVDTRFRLNARAAFYRHLDPATSRFAAQYQAMEARLQGPPARFTVSSEIVVDKMMRALEETSPRARYPVTLPTHLFAVLKRLLPDGWLDGLLVRH